MERSLTGSTPPSTWVMSSSSKARVTWKMASHALMLDKKALPNPWPSEAPLTRPAISTTLRKAGTLDAGFQWSQSQSYRSSGTGHLLSLGSMVQNGKFSAVAIEVLVRTLKKVDFPTLGRPTIPIFKFVPTRPMITGFSSSSPFFLGGILIVFKFDNFFKY